MENFVDLSLKDLTPEEQQNLNGGFFGIGPLKWPAWLRAHALRYHLYDFGGAPYA